MLRNVYERNELLKYKNNILTFSLYGYIFFGSSLQVVEQIEQACDDTLKQIDTATPNANANSIANAKSDSSGGSHTHSAMKCLFVVIDFSLVPGIDATAARSFSMLKQRVQKKYTNAHVLFCSITKDNNYSIKRLLVNHGAISVETFGSFHSMDSALAYVEDCILSKTLMRYSSTSTHTNREESALEQRHTNKSLSLSLAQILNEFVIPTHVVARWERSALQVSVKQNRKLMKYFEMKTYDRSMWLFQEGDPSNHVYIVHSGTITIYRNSKYRLGEEKRKAEKTIEKGTGKGKDKRNFTNNKSEMKISSGSFVGDLDFILERARSLSAFVNVDNTSTKTVMLFVLSRAKYHQVGIFTTITDYNNCY